LTKASGNNDSPVWSSDGKQIAFISDRTGRGQVWVMNSEGGGQRNLTRDSLNHDQLPDWSPDGKQIAYEANTDDGPPQIWVMTAEGNHHTQLTAGADFGPTWSPDGTQIAYVHVPGDGSRPIMIMNADGSGSHQLLDTTNRQFVPAWLPLAPR
jgi:TolB protein